MNRKHLFRTFLVGLIGSVLVSCSDSEPSANLSAQGTVPWEMRGGAAEVEAGVNALSDLEIRYASNGWGPLERDMSNGEAEAGDGQTLMIGAQPYEKGLGMHPAEGERTWAEVQYGLSGQCDTFSAEVGLDDEIDVQSEYGSVVFQVFADDEKLWQSEVLTGQDDAVATGRLDISQSERLKLVVTNAGDSNDYDHADWANAKVECSAASPDPTTDPPDTLPVSVRYQQDDTDFLNPERGFHDNIELLADNDVSYVREEGYTLARAYILLDDYLGKPLDEALLSKLRRGLGAARAAGIKVIPRFAYNFPTGDDYINPPEPSIDLALQHIRQLEPIYRDYADVIAVHPAGFVGPWGEWHSSDNLGTPANKRKVLDALLEALPNTRMVQLRYPGDLVDAYGQVLTPADAFSNSEQARLAHHNDCFLSNASDSGTYWPEERAAAFKTYLDTLTRFSAVGGETCQATLEQQRTDCDTALAEMERFHWDYLNIGFYEPTIKRWQNEGCFGEISKRLGYRYSLAEARASAQEVARGETLQLELDLRNSGFGKLYNPRPSEIIMVREGEPAHIVSVARDSRKLLPAPGQSKTLRISLDVPADLAAGRYDLFFNLPDANAALKARPEYSVRLANQGVWQPATGYNALNMSVQVR